MKDKHNEISDNEIRIIAPDADKPVKVRRKPSKRVWIAIVAVIAVAVLAVLAAIVLPSSPDEDEFDIDEAVQYVQPVPPVRTQTAVNDSIPVKPYTQVRDTVAGGVALQILTPVNATPSLEIGYETRSDTTIVLAAQAADIRRDNGRIVCACVVKGELLSKGVAKAGFCSIIDGEIFRQYPLVVGGQIVENKPKNKSVRKALAEIGGKACVVSSVDRITFHDFSQALVDIGVRNAIYLVGGDSLFSYKDENGNRVLRGRSYRRFSKNVNFIVWR